MVNSSSLPPTVNGSIKPETEKNHEYTISGRSYGKTDLKVVHVKRDGPLHTLKEFEVGTRLILSTTKEYTQGDNSDIVGTDAQLHTVYLFAKKYGMDSAEKFALLLATHFLEKYSHIEEVHIHVEEYPWRRICQEQIEKTYGNNLSVIKSQQEHNHAFIFTPTEIHYCNVVMRRSDPKQTVVCGIKGMRVLKTAQSTFVNYVNDEFRQTPDQHDRIFSTIVDCSWEYLNKNEVEYCQDWMTVKNIILRIFAGDSKVGIPSLSLQNVIYSIEKEVLDVLPQVSTVSMTIPNKQFFAFDTKLFQTIAPGENNEVFVSADKPDSIVHGRLTRKAITNNITS